MFVPLDHPGLSEDSESKGLIREDFLWSSKILVGYDDSQGIVYLHDPTFGPYWSVSFEDFEKMWEVGGRKFATLHPNDYETLLAGNEPIVKNISRSPKHEATICYVFGYALSSIGRNEESGIQLRKGLEIDDIEDGYRFLLNLELGMVYAKKNEFDAAIDFVKEASRI